MSSNQGFIYEESKGVGTIILNRPEKLNSLTFQIYAQLRDFLQELAQRKTARVIIFTGKGKGFCSGGDVNEIIGPLLKMKKPELLQFTRMTCDVVKNIRALKKPVIAALNGTTCGAGAVIATACDIRIAAENAKIAYLFVKVGLSGADMGIAYLLPRIIGFGRATELLMTGDFISAQEAHRIGLYNRVVPLDDLMDQSWALAEKLANGPSFGMERTKEMLNRELDLTFSESLEAEAEAQAECMLHPDFWEAYEAFRDKREPRFQR